MSIPFSLELHLDERCTDRVFVSVTLSPTSDDVAASIGGVSVQMFNRTGQVLGPRLLLPIAGALHQPMRSTVELRAMHGLPTGSRVVATAWWANGQLEATCPTDPWTELGTHMRGARLLTPDDDEDLEHLTPTERARIAALFPWVDEPMLPPEPPAAFFEPTPEDDPDAFVDGIADQYGLDEESAEWLRELMDED